MALLSYKGFWYAIPNTPSLTDGVGTLGDAYHIYNIANNEIVDFFDRDLGSGSKTWINGAYIFYNGSTWNMVGDSGGGGGGDDLQVVTDNGNQTTNDIYVIDATSGTPTAIMSQGIVAALDGTFSKFAALAVDIFGPGLGVVLAAFGYLCVLGFTTITGSRTWILPDKSGTVALTNDLPVNGNYLDTGSPGTTVYNIPHSLPGTPLFATIVPKNSDTAALLVGGYFLTYDATNIIVTLLAPTVGTPSIDIDWVV